MEVAGSAVGIVSLGIQTCQALFAYYDSWKDYESDISSTTDSIADLSKTLTLLKALLDNGSLDREKGERAKTCLQCCEEGLSKLSRKSQKLRKYKEPVGVRQKAWAELQRSWYPFRTSTLAKLREIVNDVLEQLNMALQVLQLDSSTSSQKTLTQVVTRTQTIEASITRLSAQNQCVLDTQQLDLFEKIKDWLSPPNPWSNHASARQRREPQTGTWLLQSDKYQEWKAGKRRHLWLHGKAGCGKTVLCSTLIEDIREHCDASTNSVCGIFYFSFSDYQKQSYESLLRSLVVQLGWRAPTSSMLLQAYAKLNRSLPGIEELEKILLASFESYDDVFLLFAALDECPEGIELRQHVLEGLERLTQRARNVRTLATSRELLDIRKSMEILRAEPTLIAVNFADADISRYLSAELSRDRKLSRLDSSTKALIENTISQKANGMCDL